jgi:predicted transcriptional regulator
LGLHPTTLARLIDRYELRSQLDIRGGTGKRGGVYTEQEMREAIDAAGADTMAIASLLGLSDSRVRNLLKRYGLWEEVKSTASPEDAKRRTETEAAIREGVANGLFKVEVAESLGITSGALVNRIDRYGLRRLYEQLPAGRGHSRSKKTIAEDTKAAVERGVREGWSRDQVADLLGITRDGLRERVRRHKLGSLIKKLKRKPRSGSGISQKEIDRTRAELERQVQAPKGSLNKARQALGMSLPGLRRRVNTYDELWPLAEILLRRSGRSPVRKRELNPPRRFDVRSPGQGLRAIQHPVITANYEKALRVKPKHKRAVLVPCAGTKPFPDAPSHKHGYLEGLKGKKLDVYVVSEPLGIVPYEWSRRYPQESYDFPPAHLRGPGRELLVDRIAVWFDKVAPKYEKVILALPGHHRRLVMGALEQFDAPPVKIKDVGLGACLESGACPPGNVRPTTKAYRKFLKTRANPEGFGDCYSAALNYMLSQAMTGSDAKNLRLVHATVTGQAPIEGLEYGHAWVEELEAPQIPPGAKLPPGIDPMEFGTVWAIDKSNGQDIRVPAALYRMAGQARDAKVYTYEQARRMVTKHKHYGPWPEDKKMAKKRRRRRRKNPIDARFGAPDGVPLEVMGPAYPGSVGYWDARFEDGEEGTFPATAIYAPGGARWADPRDRKPGRPAWTNNPLLLSESNPPMKACDPSKRPLKIKGLKGKFVRTHVNLHNGCFVVSHKSKVQGYTKALKLKDVRPRVGQAGWERCNTSQVRNVHAFLDGELVSGKGAKKAGKGWRQISYHCKSHGPFFFYVDTDEPFLGAKEVICRKVKKGGVEKAEVFVRGPEPARKNPPDCKCGAPKGVCSCGEVDSWIEGDPEKITPCGSPPKQVGVHVVRRPWGAALLLLDVHNLRAYSPRDWHEKGRCPLLAGFAGMGARIARDSMWEELAHHESTGRHHHCRALAELAHRCRVPFEEAEDMLCREGLAWHAAKGTKKNPCGHDHPSNPCPVCIAGAVGALGILGSRES